MYGITATAATTLFYRWLRLAPEHRKMLWSLYGWFTALVVVGSVFAIATWLTWMQCLSNFYRSNQYERSDPARWMSLTAVAYSMRPAFTACYPIAFFCISVAKLLVFDRLSDFAESSASGTWVAGKRAVFAVVVIGNVVGLAGNFSAAALFQNAATLFTSAAVSFAANNTILDVDGNKYRTLGLQQAEQAFTVESVQALSEVTVLIFIVVAILVAAIACAGIIRARLLGVNSASAAAAEGRSIMLRIAITSAVVFFAFSLRAVFSTMFAIAYMLQDTASACSSDQNKCDPACFNIYTLILRWMFYTPHFEILVDAVSSPLALLVAMWGMTTRRALQILGLHSLNSDQKKVPIVEITLNSDTGRPRV